MSTQRFHIQSMLALVSMALFGALVGSLLFKVVPDQNRELVSTALGFLAGNMVGPAFQYFFGSTAGSEKKTEALVAAAKPAEGTTTITAAPNVDVAVRQPADGELPAEDRVEPA